MKMNIGKTAAMLLASLAIVSCSDWTDAESEKIFDYDNTEVARPESYYKALREYKATKHSISFGWFGNWGDNSVSTTNMLTGIPDSMDVVSLWGGWSDISEGKKKDLKFVQEVKGTKVVFCSFTQYVGQGFTPEEHDGSTADRNAFWGWKDDDADAKEASIKKYAGAMLDTMYKYNYDGFDIDFEPNYGGHGPLASYNNLMHILIEELGKSIGPMSPNPEKLLIVDGEPQTLNAETGPYISYFVIQAYSSAPSWTNSDTNLDTRLGRGLSKFGATMSEEEITNRYVMTENLESAIDALNGGYKYYNREWQLMGYPSLVGMAKWQPVNGFMKGGFGGYHFEAEAVNSPSYRWMRAAIQAANPAKSVE